MSATIRSAASLLIVASCAVGAARSAGDVTEDPATARPLARRPSAASALPEAARRASSPAASSSPAPSVTSSATDPGAEDGEHSVPSIDVVYWPTPEVVVDKMIDLAQVKASDVLYDLGCGDARILVTAAERYGARGFGFDIDPRRVIEAERNVREHGVEALVKIEQADVFTLDLSPASVVFLYLLTRLNDRLVPQLEQLRPGARVVSHEFEMPRVWPSRVLHVLGPPDGPPETDPKAAPTRHTLYLWRMPWQRRPAPAD